jgi:hypothetical protein
MGKSMLPYQVVCLAIFIVVGLNAAIYALLVRGDAYRQFDLLRKATKQVQKPWKSEDDALADLSRLAQELKKDKHG